MKRGRRRSHAAPRPCPSSLVLDEGGTTEAPSGLKSDSGFGKDREGCRRNAAAGGAVVVHLYFNNRIIIIVDGDGTQVGGG